MTTPRAAFESPANDRPLHAMILSLIIFAVTEASIESLEYVAPPIRPVQSLLSATQMSLVSGTMLMGIVMDRPGGTVGWILLALGPLSLAAWETATASSPGSIGPEARFYLGWAALLPLVGLASPESKDQPAHSVRQRLGFSLSAFGLATLAPVATGILAPAVVGAGLLLIVMGWTLIELARRPHEPHGPRLRLVAASVITSAALLPALGAMCFLRPAGVLPVVPAALAALLFHRMARAMGGRERMLGRLTALMAVLSVGLALAGPRLVCRLAL